MTQATANDCEQEEMLECKSAVDIRSKCNQISLTLWGWSWLAKLIGGPWEVDLGGGPGRWTWEVDLGGGPGRWTWEVDLGGGPGRWTWEVDLGGGTGKVI